MPEFGLSMRKQESYGATAKIVGAQNNRIKAQKLLLEADPAQPFDFLVQNFIKSLEYEKECEVEQALIKNALNSSLTAKDLMYQNQIEERDAKIATLSDQVKVQKEALYLADQAFGKINAEMGTAEKIIDEAHMVNRGARPRSISLKKAEIDEIYRRYDADENGDLDKEEAKKFLKDLYIEVNGCQPEDHTIEGTYKMIDESGDGRIQKEELKEYIYDLKLGLAFDWC